MARHARWSNTISSRLGFDLYSGNAILNSSFFPSDRKRKEDQAVNIKLKTQNETNPINENEPTQTHDQPNDASQNPEPEKLAESRSSEASSEVSQNSSLPMERSTRHKASFQKRLRNKLERGPREMVVNESSSTRPQGGTADSKYVSDWMLKIDEVRDAIKSRTECEAPKEVASEEKFDRFDFNVDDENDIIQMSKEIISKLSEGSRQQYSGLLPKTEHFSELALRDFDEDSNLSLESDRVSPMKIGSWFPRKKKKSKSSYSVNDDVIDEQFRTIRMAIKVDDDAQTDIGQPKTRKKLTKKKVKNDFTSSLSASQTRNTNGRLRRNVQAISKKKTIPIEVLRPDILSSWKSGALSLSNM